jgi:hypothetical protein
VELVPLLEDRDQNRRRVLRGGGRGRLVVDRRHRHDGGRGRLCLLGHGHLPGRRVVLGGRPRAPGRRDRHRQHPELAHGPPATGDGSYVPSDSPDRTRPAAVNRHPAATRGLIPT